MPEGSLTSILLVLLIALVCACLYVLLKSKKAATGVDLSGSLAAAETEVAVLRERIAGKEQDINILREQTLNLDQQLSREREAVVTLKEELSRQQTLLQEERGPHAEKIILLNNAREQMSLEFKNLANEILEQKGKAFTEVNKQNIQDILKPLNEKIQNFEKKVEDTYANEAKERFSLAKEIKSLQELNVRISTDAVNLTKALKGESKTQGTWGEVILARVLEKSGLEEGREYELQVSLKNEAGRSQQPDVIVHLPEGKDVIIDSKVSLTAYEAYCSASESDENPLARQQESLKQHIASIRTHIKQLSAKDYHKLDGVKSLDFVMMFLPVEAAFTLAVQHDADLFTEAFEKNIILVGPSTLLATLRTIQNIWRYEHQNKNALKIATQAGALYDKFVNFVEDLDKIGSRLRQTQTAYDAAQNKLVSGTGNLVNRVKNLEKLGARASKKLPTDLLEDAAAELLEDPDLENDSDND